MSPNHHERIVQIIVDVVGEMNESRDRDLAVPTAPDSVLIGDGGPLDSLGIVTLVVMLEAQLEQAFGEPITVMDVVLAGATQAWTVASLAAAIAAEVEHAVAT